MRDELTQARRRRRRRWLEYIAQQAIDMLDEMDREDLADGELEDDEREPALTREEGVR